MFECLGLIVLYVVAVIALATLCLRTITLIPDIAFHWIDVALGNVAGSAEAEAGAGLKGGGRGVPGGADRSVAFAGTVGNTVRDRWRNRKNRGHP